MEQITHEFKAGDWVDTSGLSKEQIKAIIDKAVEDGAKREESYEDYDDSCVFTIDRNNETWFVKKHYIGSKHWGDVVNVELTWQQLTAPIDDKPLTDAIIMDWLNGTSMATTIDLRCTELQEVLLKFSFDEIKAMDRLDNAGERHDQQIDAADDDGIFGPEQKPYPKHILVSKEEHMKSIAERNQPYTPKVGEECEWSNIRCDLPCDGQWYKGYYAGNTSKGTKLMQQESNIVWLDESDGDIFSFRPLKTERELLVEKAIATLPKTPDCISPDAISTIYTLIDAGLIK
jgi:hypothetical protein